MKLEAPPGGNGPFAVQICEDGGRSDVTHIDVGAAHRSTKPPESAIVGVEVQTQ
jgi:hypothetical protein